MIHARPFSAFYGYVRENHIPQDDVIESLLNTLAAHGLAGVAFDELKRVEEADCDRSGNSEGDSSVKREIEWSVLIGLCSAIVHYQELHSEGGKPVDLNAAEGALATLGVRELMKELDRMACLPVRRDGVKP